MSKTSLTASTLFGSALALGIGLAGVAQAGNGGDLFSAVDLDRGYTLVAGNEGKCGEGKCGGDDAGKGGEGACGAGKGGEGSCGADGDKGSEGKCGEGKCGNG